MAYINPNVLEEDWDNVVGWDDLDNNGGVSSISPAGQLYLDNRAMSADGRARRNQDIGAIGSGNYYVEIKFKGDVWDGYGSAYNFGLHSGTTGATYELAFGIGNNFVSPSGDGIYVDDGAGKILVYEHTWDTNWHTIVFFVHNSQTDVDIWIDKNPATEEADVIDADCSKTAGDDGYVFISSYGSAAGNGEYHIDYLYVGTILAGAYTLTAAVGAFTLTGISTLFIKAIDVACAVGNFILTGISAALRSQFQIIDSYSETNRDADFSIFVTGESDYGQSFEGDGKVITACKFYLRKEGSPTGNLYAHIYAHSGVYGTSSLPTGGAIASSDPYDVTGLTGSHQLIKFTFSGGDRITLVDGTKYCIVLYFGDGDGANKVLVGYDDSAPGHPGNAHTITVAYANKDICFYVYGITEYALTAAVGAFILTGIATLFTKALNLICAVGSFVLTGIAALFSKGWKMSVAVGEFILTGIAITLTKTLKMAVSVGSFVLTGISTGLGKVFYPILERLIPPKKVNYPSAKEKKYQEAKKVNYPSAKKLI